MRLIAILLLCAAPPTSAAFDTSAVEVDGATQESKDTSKLVDTAKESKEKRKKSTSKVITNEDLKKSKGKLIELSEKDLPKVEPKKSDGPTMLQKQDAELKARREAEVRLAAAEKEVADLERDLVRVEQSYFEENDPNVRDTQITQRFADTKAKLEKARAELKLARAALEEPKNP